MTSGCLFLNVLNDGNGGDKDRKMKKSDRIFCFLCELHYLWLKYYNNNE